MEPAPNNPLKQFLDIDAHQHLIGIQNTEPGQANPVLLDTRVDIAAQKQFVTLQNELLIQVEIQLKKDFPVVKSGATIVEKQAVDLVNLARDNMIKKGFSTPEALAEAKKQLAQAVHSMVLNNFKFISANSPISTSSSPIAPTPKANLAAGDVSAKVSGYVVKTLTSSGMDTIQQMEFGKDILKNLLKLLDGKEASSNNAVELFEIVSKLIAGLNPEERKDALIQIKQNIMGNVAYFDSTILQERQAESKKTSSNASISHSQPVKFHEHPTEAKRGSSSTGALRKSIRRLSSKFTKDEVDTSLKQQSGASTAALTSAVSSRALGTNAPPKAPTLGPAGSNFMLNWVKKHQNPEEVASKPGAYHSPAHFQISKKGEISDFKGPPPREEKKANIEFKKNIEFTALVLIAAAEIKAGSKPTVKDSDVLKAAQLFIGQNPDANVRDLRNLSSMYLNDNGTSLSDDIKERVNNYEGLVTQVAVSISPSAPHPGNPGEEVFRYINTIIYVTPTGDQPPILPLLADFKDYSSASESDLAKRGMQNFQQMIGILGQKFGVSPEALAACFAEIKGINPLEDAKIIFNALNRNETTRPVANAMYGLTQHSINAVSNVIGTAMSANKVTLGQAQFPRSDHPFLKTINIRETPSGFNVDIDVTLSDLRAISKVINTPPADLRTQIKAEATYKIDFRISYSIDAEGQFSEPKVVITDAEFSKVKEKESKLFRETLKELQPT